MVVNQLQPCCLASVSDQKLQVTLNMLLKLKDTLLVYGTGQFLLAIPGLVLNATLLIAIIRAMLLIAIMLL